MPGYRVTRRVLEDLKNIGRYTEQQWGRHQRNTYLKALENRFGWLAENPKARMLLKAISTYPKANMLSST